MAGLELDPALATALSEAAALAARAREPWWIVGSAAVRLHGGQTTVADIDLLMGEADARSVLEAAGVVPRPGGGSALFRSALFGTVRGGALPVDVMGQLSLRSASGSEPVALVTREPVGAGGVTVWVPARGELVALLRRFGREKDLARAALLEALPPG